jgi:hydroxyacylglutathione hydrolase
LDKLSGLPDETMVYCAHEYTEANGRFARTVERDNADLMARIEDIRETRLRGEPTIPTNLGLERRTNPFLRVGKESVKAAVGLAGAPEADVFTELRRRKDVF